MATSQFNIKILVQNLNALRKLGQKVKNLGRDMKRSFNQGTRAIKNTNRAVEQNGRFLSQSAERLGFMAFQFVFLQGIASRALGQIKQLFTQVFEGGLESIDAMVRAISQSGIDISRSTQQSRQAIEFLNDAILDLGGGKTIFNIVEVSEAVRDIGKATAFTGSEMSKATKLIGITQQVLRLMTIEQINVEQGAIGLVKTMKNFNLELGEAKRATDALIRVNQNSAITLDQLIRAFGFSAQQAKKFGLEIEETAALLGILGDRLGQGAGASGRNFDILLRNLRTNAFKAEGALNQFGQTLFTVVDGRNQMKDFRGVLDALRAAFKKAGPAAGVLRIALEKQLGLTSRATRALDIFLSVENEVIDAATEFAKSGQISSLSEIFTATPEAQFTRLKNSIEALKVLFVGSFSPAVIQASQALQALVRTNDAQSFIVELGKALSEEIIPVIKIAAQLFGLFAKFLKQNAALTKVLVKAFILLLGLLAAMFIVGVVGTLVTALGSVFIKLAGAMGIASLTAKTLLIAMLRLVFGVIAIAGIIIGVRQLFKTLIDGFQDGEESIIALSLLLVGLGLALSFAVGGVPGLIVALAALAATGGFILGKKFIDDGTFEELGKTAVELKDQFVNLFAGLNVNAIAAFASNLGRVIEEDFNNATTAVGEFFESLQRDFSAQLDQELIGISLAIDGVVDSINEAISASSKFAGEFVENLVNTILTGAAEATAAMATLAEDLSNAFINTIKAKIMLLFRIVEWITEGIDQALKDMFAFGEQLGEQIAEGIRSGVGDALKIGEIEEAIDFEINADEGSLHKLDAFFNNLKTNVLTIVAEVQRVSKFALVGAVPAPFNPFPGVTGPPEPIKQDPTPLNLGLSDIEISKTIRDTVKDRDEDAPLPLEPGEGTIELPDVKSIIGNFAPLGKEEIGTSILELLNSAGLKISFAKLAEGVDELDAKSVEEFSLAMLTVSGTLLSLSDAQLALIGLNREQLQAEARFAATRLGLEDEMFTNILSLKGNSAEADKLSDLINMEANAVQDTLLSQARYNKILDNFSKDVANTIGTLPESINFVDKLLGNVDEDIFSEVIGIVDNLKITVQKAGEDFATVVVDTSKNFDTVVQEGAIKIGKSAVVASKNIKQISVAAVSFAKQIDSLSLSELTRALDLIDLTKSIEIDAGKVEIGDIDKFFEQPIAQALESFDLSVIAAIFDGLGEVTQSNSFQMLELIGAVQGLTDAELQQLGITQAEITALIARVATIEQLSAADIALVLSTNSTGNELKTLKDRLAQVTSSQSNLMTAADGVTLTFGPLNLTLAQVETAMQGLRDQAVATTVALGNAAGQVIQTGEGEFKITLKEDLAVTAGIINDETEKIATSMGGISRESDAMAAAIKAEADRVALEFQALFDKINADPFATTGGFEQREVIDPETGEKTMENIVPPGGFVSADALAIRDKMLQDLADSGQLLVNSSMVAAEAIDKVAAEVTTITDSVTGLQTKYIKLTEEIGLQASAVDEGTTTILTSNFTMGELHTAVLNTIPPLTDLASGVVDTHNNLRLMDRAIIEAIEELQAGLAGDVTLGGPEIPTAGGDEGSVESSIALNDITQAYITSLTTLVDTFRESAELYSALNEALLIMLETMVVQNEAALASNFALLELNNVVSKQILTFGENIVAVIKLTKTETEKLIKENDQILLIIKLSGILTELIATEIRKNELEIIQNALLDRLNQIYTAQMIPTALDVVAEMEQTVSILNKVQLAFDELIQAIRNLTAKIARTQVKFEKNDEGDIIGFDLVGGVSKQEVFELASDTFGPSPPPAPKVVAPPVVTSDRRRPPAESGNLTQFATGGIVDKEMLALVGEEGPEAIIPLSRLEEFLKPALTKLLQPQIDVIVKAITPVQPPNVNMPDIIIPPPAEISVPKAKETTTETNVTNEININVDGIADDTSAEEIAERIAEVLNDQISNKSIVLRSRS